ncbi:MAG TPA: single-stranded DNA-binding protein [Acidimicrobiia bacterium]|nr:single-stranded DNA-binding protein [Acidimicrobiia bacterium]
MTNLTVLVGELSSPPEIRLLDSGTRLAHLSVRTRGDGDRHTSVPVTIWDPPTTIETLAEADEVVVVGRIERRFFRRRDAGTGSRVEVVATTVALASDRRRSGVALRRAREHLETAAG